MNSTTTKCVAPVAVAVLLACMIAQAQEGRSSSLGDLRKEIQALMVIDRDESTPAEVKALNREFIRRRQLELRRLLNQTVDSLQKYRASPDLPITGDERKLIDEKIVELRKESQDLDHQLTQNPASVQTTTLPQSDRAANEVPAPKNESSTDSAPSSNRTTAADAPRVRPQGSGSTDPQLRSGNSKPEERLRQEFETERSLIVDEVVNDVRGKKSAAERTRGAATFSPLQRPTAYAKILGLALSMNTLPRAQFTKEIEESRVDEQVGGAATNAGSTSLVSKGSIPAILGLAVENGGLAKSEQGTTITFRGNFVGLFDAFAGKGFLDSAEGDSLTIQRLRKLSFALSYDTSLGNTPNVFVGNRQQLSSYSFRYEFFNHRDPRDPTYTEKWAELMRNNAQAVATSTNRVQNLFFRDPGLRTWLENARKAIADADDSDLPNVVRTQLDALETMELSPTVKEAVSNFSAAFSEYRHKRAALLNIVANGPIFTVDYTNNRRPGLIDTSNLNFIYSTGVAEGKASLTFNGSATIFNSKPAAGMKRLRDFDFSAQLDIPLGDPRGFGQFDLSFAGQYKRLAENEIVNGTKMKTKGDIGTLNLKLEIPIKNLGIRFPFSLTYSNRTEFDLKRQLRGNFGFAFDPDILYNLLKPLGQK